MSWAILGAINGHYAVSIWVRAYRVDSGILVAEARIDTGAYQLDVPDDTAYTLTLTADIGKVWQPGLGRYIGDLVFPTDVKSMPYYYRCTGTGASGSKEPAFVADPLVVILDGDCEWERVERIPWPAIQSPVIPTLI